MLRRLLHQRILFCTLSALFLFVLLALQSPNYTSAVQDSAFEQLQPIVPLPPVFFDDSDLAVNDSSSGHAEGSSTGHDDMSSSSSSTGSMDMRPPCIRFGGESGQSQVNYVTAIISNAVFGNTTYNHEFIGLFSPEGAVYSWFDGSRQFRANGQFVNFTANNGSNDDASVLLTHMVEFLGPTLGCNATDFPSYMSINTLYDIHRNMNFGQNEMDFFVAQLAFGFEYTSAVTEPEKNDFRMFFGGFGRCAPSYNQTCNDMSCTLASNALPSEACELLYPSSVSASLCSKYTYLLSAQSVFPGGDSVQNEQKLISEIILRAINGSTDSTPVVDGLFSMESPLRGWFNGTVKYRPDAPDYMTNKTAFDDLALHFVSYFGDLLDCNAPGWNQHAYNFSMGRYNMYEVHRDMGIHPKEMEYFLLQLSLSLESFTFSQDDLDQFNQSTKIFYREGASILGYPGQICGESDCPLAEPNDPFLYMNFSSSTGGSEPTMSICNTYFGNTTEEQTEKIAAFMSLIFLGNSSKVPPVEGIMNIEALKPFFNGEVLFRENGKSVNFTADDFKSNDFVQLMDHFTHYFLHFFECEPMDPLPPIDNPELWEIHRNMKISNIEFSAFNQQILTAANATGFDHDHLTSLKSILNVFGRCAGTFYGGFAQICNANVTGPNACPDSIFALPPMECDAQYVGDSVCARLTYLNFNYPNVQSEADFLMQLTTVLFNGTDGVPGLLDKNSMTLLYFNGTIKYHGNDTVDFTDYEKNNDLIVRMLMKTYTHLGQILGCSAPGFGLDAYDFMAPNQNLYEVHQGMDVDDSVMSYYINQTTLALKHFGATNADIGQVQQALGLYGKCGVDPNGYLVEICSGEGCVDSSYADCSKYSGDDSSSNKNKIIIGVCVGVGGFLLLAIAYYCYRKRGAGATSSEHESRRLMSDEADVDYRSTR